MQLSRRDFLRLAAQAGIAAPLILNGSGCAVLGHDRFDDETGLSLGYVAGDVTADGAVVWLRAEPGSSATIEYAKDPALAGAASTAPVPIVAESDYTAQITLRGLDPAAVYYYRAVVAGKKPGPVARFKTAPRADDAAMVKFCFSGDTRESYKPFTIMDAIGSMQPDFFVHLGDTIYADRGGTASRLQEFWAKYRANRDDAPSRRLCSQASWYVMWDDHEVRDNYDHEDPIARIGQRAFLDYWPIRHDAAEPTRIYRSFRWGKALELFLLDNRQY
ncbi:MAG TPA: alkaline phosphatase D family protein, partial [Candidatus Binatia bacterium]|nr:alkaline phosphatase D family protein [Candidatus Binatia bacterium]